MAAQPQREWFEKDYYKVLGVPEEATDKDIRRAYRKLAKEHHPDSNPGHEDRFKEISAAYDVLSDAEKRTAYDEVQRLGPRRGDDLETELHLSFLDAVNGVTTTVNLTSEMACHTCRGSGAAPGTAPVVCPTCGGRGA